MNVLDLDSRKYACSIVLLRTYCSNAYYPDARVCIADREIPQAELLMESPSKQGTRAEAVGVIVQAWDTMLSSRESKTPVVSPDDIKPHNTDMGDDHRELQAQAQAMARRSIDLEKSNLKESTLKGSRPTPPPPLDKKHLDKNRDSRSAGIFLDFRVRQIALKPS